MKRILLIIFLLTPCLTSCEKTPDEALIRQALDSIKTAVEQRQPKSVLEHIAANFKGPNGMNRRQLRGLMAAHFFRNKRINSIIVGLRIEVQGHDATVTFKIAVTGGIGILPERAQYYSVETDWQKLDGAWKIARADWRLVTEIGDG